MGDNFETISPDGNSIDLKNKKVSIIGLGLIGGSIAKVLRQRLNVQDITAIDSNEDTINLAVLEGTATRGFTSLNSNVFDSDIVFLCAPVKQSIQYIDILARNAKPDCIITDVCSTKSEIEKHVNTLANPPCFVGGHPMAGSEKMGYSASFPHIFENAYYILTPYKCSSDYGIRFLENFIKAIGAIPVILGSEDHDKIAGSISHLPHIVAFTLVNLIKETDTFDGKMQMLAAGGFKDITRIASSSPEMWESIVLSNKPHLIKILEKYMGSLNKVLKYIESEDSKSIYSFFKNAKSYRDSFTDNKKGLIVPLYEIIVDVVDKPGIIGEIATILGSNNINIKNINVSNSREFEQGCLRITLPDSLSVNIAFDSLADKGYKVYKNG